MRARRIGVGIERTEASLIGEDRDGVVLPFGKGYGGGIKL